MKTASTFAGALLGAIATLWLHAPPAAVQVAEQAQAQAQAPAPAPAPGGSSGASGVSGVSGVSASGGVVGHATPHSQRSTLRNQAHPG